MNNTRLASNIFFSLLIIFFLSSEFVLAQVRMGSIDPSRNTTLPNWSGAAGDVVSTTTFCARSVNDATGLAVPYQIRVYNQTGGAGNPYSLTSGGKPDIPVGWEFSDLLNPGYETLTPNVYTAFNKTGSLCPGGSTIENAALRMTISQASLMSAEAGTYTRRFTVEMSGGNGGTETRRVGLGITITIVPLIKISGLNDITFPIFDQINPLIASDSFCIYRNGAGLYSVQATGSGAGLAFTLANGPSTLAYTPTWNDGNTTTALVANTTLTNRANAFTTNMDCNSGANNNATVELTISVADINAAPQATYTGTLTILVTPQ
jgi:hypothetical protein